jgi:hypothetical protein
MCRGDERVRFAAVLAALALLGSGCASPDPDEDIADGSSTGAAEPPREIPVDLVWSDRWIADPLADAIPAHAPDPVDCAIGFGDERGLFEVDTSLCNYGVFSQPMSDRIIAGERVALEFTHDALVAPEPAIGHLAVSIEGRLIWQTDVPIPSPHDIVKGEWIADATIDAGTKIALHIHNHGYNNWRVISFKSGALR